MNSIAKYIYKISPNTFIKYVQIHLFILIKMKKPAFLMVLCGIAPFAYQRKDSVYVVPIGCLKD